MEIGFDQRDKISESTVTLLSKQSGTVRTNCMDCLDRTNVVQSVFGRVIAQRQLWKLTASGNEPTGEPFESFQGGFEEIFREAWTDNANALSILYSGTPALKTDFTRLGKRTFMGALNDGMNSCRRYYINNYCDGYNQDCLDLALGKLQPTSKIIKRSFLSPLKISFFLVSSILLLSESSSCL